MQSAQQQMAQAQAGILAKMEALTVVGHAPNQLVTVRLNGAGRVEEIKIHPECVRPDDLEGLEDLIKIAINDASAKLEEATKSLVGPASASYYG